MVEGIFACGNVLQVHDLVDFVSEEAELTGKSVAEYIKNGEKQRNVVNAINGKNVSYVLPQKIDKNAEKFVKLFFRVTGSYKNAKITLKSVDKVLLEKTKKIVVPGEMENIIVPINLIKDVKDDIILSVEV